MGIAFLLSPFQLPPPHSLSPLSSQSPLLVSRLPVPEVQIKQKVITQPEKSTVELNKYKYLILIILHYK